MHFLLPGTGAGRDFPLFPERHPARTMRVNDLLSRSFSIHRKANLFPTWWYTRTRCRILFRDDDDADFCFHLSTLSIHVLHNKHRSRPLMRSPRKILHFAWKLSAERAVTEKCEITKQKDFPYNKRAEQARCRLLYRGVKKRKGATCYFLCVGRNLGLSLISSQLRDNWSCAFRFIDFKLIAHWFHGQNCCYWTLKMYF